MNNNVAPSSILCCLLHILFLGESAALEVVETLSPVEALLNHDVIIPCMISGYKTSEWNIANVAILWTRKSRDGKEEDLYEYNNGIHKSIRPGSKILQSELVKGNAGLHLPLIQISDEGQYRCNIFFTPDKAAGSCTLTVSAPPTANVAPPSLVIELGTEKSVMCEANGFYPELLKLQWVRYLKDSNTCVTLEKNTCTGSPVANPDGTYNVTSHLTLNPLLKDDGNIYSCIMEHKSILKEIALNISLTVKERESTSSAIIGAVLGTLCGAALVGYLCFFIYKKYFKKVSPKLSEITGNESMVHMNRTTLSCQISGFKPKPIEIILYMKRTGGNPVKMDSLKPTEIQPVAQTSSKQDNGGDLQMVVEPEREQMLTNGETDADNTLQGTMKLKRILDIKNNRNGTFTYQCSIEIIPNIEEDDKAEVYLHVKHVSLPSPISVSCILNVIGVSPKLSNIVPPLRIYHGVRLTLTCSINGFKPRPIVITWLKKVLDTESELLIYDSNTEIINNPKYSHSLIENEHEDKSSSFLSILTMKPMIKEDNEAIYICRTHHAATGNSAEKTLQMLVWAPPELDPIRCSQEVFYIGEKMQLSCKIHSFFPEPLTACWYKDDELMKCSNDNALAEADGRFHFNSTLLYVPNVKDVEKIIKCEVRHQSLEKPKNVTWKIENLVSIPKISSIRCEPEVPECNKPVKLLCIITNYYPKQCTIHWYRGLQIISTSDELENTQQDRDSGLFYRTTEWQFTPTAIDHGTEFRVEVAHRHKVLVSQSLFLALKGFPIFKDIYSETVPTYGAPVTICCNVKGCNPQHIKTEWLENYLPVKKCLAAETLVNEKDGELIISYLLKLIPTAEDHGQVFSCLVKHKDMPEPIKKHLYLRLPEKTPILSDFTANPAPKINKETTFKINISGFAPKVLKVKWFKGFTELSENTVTSKPKIEKDFLYSCTSELKYTPNENDDNEVIRCEVTHKINRKTQEKQYVFKLRVNNGRNSSGSTYQPLQDQTNFGKEGIKIQTSKIQCLTTNPNIGEDVTLSCFVKGLDVNDGIFSWWNGMYPINVGQIYNVNKPDGSGCISTVTFKLEKNGDCKIRFEVTVNYRTVEETYVLQLD